MTTETLPAPIEQQLLDIYEAMPAPLRRVADFIKQQSNRENLGLIKIGYQIGQKIADVMADKDSFGVEAEAIKQLAAYTGRHRDELYDFRNLVRIYPDWKELEALVIVPMKDGSTMTMSHMKYVCRLGKAADRKKMIKRIINESLTANATRIETTAGFEARNTRSGGRNPSKPTSPQAGYQQIRNEAQRINNRFEQTWKEVFDEVDESSPDNLDPALKQKAEDALAELDKLEQHIMQSRPRLEQNLKRMEEVITERETKTKNKNKD